MKRKFNGIDINFRVHYSDPSRNNVVLLLHGWGGSLNSFRALETYLKESGLSTINMDFPGFGASEKPQEDFDLMSYCQIVYELILNERLTQVSIVAHSFGGRVAILLSAIHPELIKKLVLVDSAGLKKKQSLLTKLKICWYRTLKNLAKKRVIHVDLSRFGSEDYKALPESMKPVFVRIVNQDLESYLPKITCPTLLIWGDKDKDTPLYFAKKMNRMIADSAIIVLKNAGHFGYLKYHAEFERIVKTFLTGEGEHV